MCLMVRLVNDADDVFTSQEEVLEYSESFDGLYPLRIVQLVIAPHARHLDG